jgi:hypothetical protein
MRKATTKPLQPEVLQALAEYATWAGKGWKDRLVTDWMRAGSRFPGDYSILHCVRNAPWGGPEWLDRFDFDDHK